MYNITYQENSEKSVDTYDKFVGAEVCIPDEWGRKIMSRVTKHVKDNDCNTKGIEHPSLFAYH